MMASNVNTTEIKIHSLSKNDIVDVIGEVFKLPTRIVRDLADVTYKKTSGHAVRKYFHFLLNNESI